MLLNTYTQKINKKYNNTVLPFVINDKKLENSLKLKLILMSTSEHDIKIAFYLIKQFIARINRFIISNICENQESILKPKGLENNKVLGERFVTQPIETTKSLKSRKQIITVIRAAFVFKKSREQFNLKKIKSISIIKMENKTQLEFVLQSLSQLKLPVELKVVIL